MDREGYQEKGIGKKYQIIEVITLYYMLNTSIFVILYFFQIEFRIVHQQKYVNSTSDTLQGDSYSFETGIADAITHLEINGKNQLHV